MPGLSQYWKTIGWSVIMLILFLLPANSLSNAPSVPFVSELSHLILFAGFTLFLVWDRTKIKSLSRPSLQIYAWAVISSLVFGLCVEILQYLCGFGRAAEILDVVFDLTGSILSAVAIALYFLLQGLRTPKD
jgi:glycopeptide antibiotics resistance protein